MHTRKILRNRKRQQCKKICVKEKFVKLNKASEKKKTKNDENKCDRKSIKLLDKCNDT